MTSASNTLAEFAVGLTYERIPAEIVERAKDCIIDTVGACVFGSQLSWTQIVIEHAKRNSAAGECSVFGTAVKLRAPFACLSNGASAHAFELDALCEPSVGIHPSAALCVPGLAPSQGRKGNGRALLSAIVAWKFGLTWQTALALVFAWTLIALTFIDADTTLLPDDLTLPLLWLGLLANVYGLFVPLKDAVLGAAAGYLVLWFIYWVFKLTTGKEGMGYGDFKLLAALGAWMGWKALLPIVLLSSLVGAVVGIALIVLARRGREIPIPFGPYLGGRK